MLLLQYISSVINYEHFKNKIKQFSDNLGQKKRTRKSKHMLVSFFFFFFISCFDITKIYMILFKTL